MATSTAIDAHIKPLSRVDRKERKTIESVFFAVLFIATIFGLGISTIKRFTIPAGTIALQENRTFAALPDLKPSYTSLRAFPSAFDSFYDDRFAFRNDLIGNMALLKYKCFDLSTTGKVLVGRDGWLYFMDGGDEESLRSTPLFTDKDLADWTCMLEERRAWCADRHIKFLFVISPNKSSIYRKFVPPQYTTLNAESKADQLLRYLKEHSKIETLDLRKPLLAARSMGQVYFKTDTHWNSLGCFCGYRAIMGRLKQWFPQLKPLALADMNIRKNVPFPGDLASMMGLEHRLCESYDELVPKKQYTWKFAPSPPPHDLKNPKLCWEPFATEADLKNAPKAFFIRDSFMVMPQPFMSQTFKHAYFYWKAHYDFPAQAIANDKPDVLIQEMIERQLNRPVPPNPPELLLTEQRDKIWR